jgi:hypothetical protein
MLKAKGITLIAASAPTFFVEDTPTAVVAKLAAVQFEKATTGRSGRGAWSEFGDQYARVRELSRNESFVHQYARARRRRKSARGLARQKAPRLLDLPRDFDWGRMMPRYAKPTSVH